MITVDIYQNCVYVNKAKTLPQSMINACSVECLDQRAN